MDNRGTSRRQALRMKRSILLRKIKSIIQAGLKLKRYPGPSSLSKGLKNPFGQMEAGLMAYPL
jgi:hypothetical protein